MTLLLIFETLLLTFLIKQRQKKIDFALSKKSEAKSILLDFSRLCFDFALTLLWLCFYFLLRFCFEVFASFFRKKNCNMCIIFAKKIFFAKKKIVFFVKKMHFLQKKCSSPLRIWVIEPEPPANLNHFLFFARALCEFGSSSHPEIWIIFCWK